MTIRSLALSMLGMAGLALPAHATLSFFTGPAPATSAVASFDSAVGGIPFVILQAQSVFDPANLSGTPEVYMDPESGAEFLGFKLTGGANGIGDSLAVPVSEVQQVSSGGIIEIILPLDTFAFAANIETLFPASGGTYCIGINEPGFNTSSECDETFGASATGNTFIGIVNTTTAITTIWIGPSNPNSTETTEIATFQIADVPEVPPAGTIGAGLILLGVMRRRILRVAARWR